MDRLFLDANVLFSAAYRPDSGLRQLWETGVKLLTSRYALAEARRNLSTPKQRRTLDELMAAVEVVNHSGYSAWPAEVHLPEKDRPILLAALASGSTHLLTGDVKHFGPYYGQRIGRILVLPPSDYLRSQR